MNVIALLYENRMSNGEWDYCSGDYRHTRYGEVSLKRSESRNQCHIIYLQSYMSRPGAWGQAVTGRVF